MNVSQFSVYFIVIHTVEYATARYKINAPRSSSYEFELKSEAHNLSSLHEAYHSLTVTLTTIELVD